MRPHLRSSLFVMTFAMIFGVPSLIFAQSGSWSSLANGTWSNAANWTGGIVANGADNTATFATAGFTTARTVTLDSNRTIGNLFFDNPTNNLGWTIGGGNILTLSTPATPAVPPTITVNNAALTASIAARLAGTQGLVKTGPGTISLTGDSTMTGGINVQQGVLAVTAAGGTNPLAANVVTLSGGTLRLGGGGGGFNQRMVVPVGTTFATSGITATMDGGTTLAGNTWYELGQNVAAPTTGVPMGQTFASQTNPTFMYTTQPATSNNVIMFDTAAGNSTGRLTLVTPTLLPQVSFLTSSGNAGSTAPTITATLHYSDGTEDVTGLTFTSTDWFNGTPVALTASGRIDAGGYNNVGTTNPRLYDAIITNPNPASPISSIDLSWQVGSNGNAHTAIFAINAPVLNGDPAQNFTNNVVVTADSGIDVRTFLGATMGNVSIGSNTLSITGINSATLTLGAFTLTGNANVSVAPGLVTTVGAFSDGGTPRTFTKSGGGIMTFPVASPGISAGATMAISGGTVNLNNAGGFGTSTNVSMSGGSLQLGSAINPSFRGLTGSGGVINLNSNAMTINTPTGQSATYSGTIADGSGPGSLIKSGVGSQTLSGFGSYSGGTTVNAGNLITSPGSIGSGAVSLATGGTLTVSPGPSSITGFGGNGAGMSLNGSATVASDVLTLTPPAAGQAGSAFFAQKVGTGNFTASFTYTASNGSGNPADGFAFMIHNDSRGPAALGPGGGELGYTGITPSAAVAINIYTPNTRGYKVVTNGTAPNAGPYTSVAPVALYTATFDPIDFTVTYDATAQTLALHLAQQTTSNVFDVVIPTVDLPTLVGPNGFIGFSGGTGGEFANQTISNFVFNGQANTRYTNDVNVAASANATIAVNATTVSPTVTMGLLNMGAGATLNVTPAAGAPTNTAFGLTMGDTTLNGVATFNVVNNGTGTGTLRLGNVNDVGTTSIVKTGNGTLMLSGLAAGLANGIQVNGGTLAVAAGANTGLGAVTVNTGATISGNGTVAGPLTINNGATIAPGPSIGALIVNGITALKVGGTLIFEHSVSASSPAPTTAADYLNGVAGGTLDLSALSTSGKFNIQLAPVFDGTSVGTPIVYTIGTFSSGVTLPTGFSGPNLTPLFNISGPFVGASPTVTLSGQNVLITFTPVPEPMHILLICGVATGGIGWLRRRRNSPR